jgi:RES domain-containing protein
LPETALREVLADFRPNLAAQQRHIERYGPEAAQDFVAEPVTAQWRTQHVLVPVALQLDGPLIDLTDVPTRQEVEDRHLDLLFEYDMQHLDLPEITTRRRPITQTIAADLFDRGVSAVRFPSKLDGNPCFALFEGRGEMIQADDPVALTDPPPEALTNVTAPWRLALEPAPAVARR